MTETYPYIAEEFDCQFSFSLDNQHGYFDTYYDILAYATGSFQLVIKQEILLVRDGFPIVQFAAESLVWANSYESERGNFTFEPLDDDGVYFSLQPCPTGSHFRLESPFLIGEAMNVDMILFQNLFRKLALEVRRAFFDQYSFDIQVLLETDYAMKCERIPLLKVDKLL